jgi:sugar O-acyltransferase (sialic acid O-acetyltransferase NeuD family)
MPHRWLILGSGGHGRSVADAIRAQGDAVLGFLDDNRSADELVAGDPVLGPLRLAWDVKTLPCPERAPTPDRFVVAFGNPVLRQRWQQVLEAAGAPVGVVVHPRACVSPSAQLAPGCVVLAGAVINADAQLERGVLVNSGAVVDHDAFCGAYSQLGVNAAMAGGARLGPLASLAAGEVLGCGERRFAELELAPGAADLGEGVSCAGSAG